MSATEEEDMNAGVAVFPPAHPWSQLPTTTCLNSTLSDAHAWIRPVHDSPHPPREKMSAGEPSLDLQHLEAQMDFFHKLGYSTAQVRAIQHKFGPNTDTDKVLGELVRTDASKQAKQGPVTMMSVVLPRGEVQAAGPTLQLPVTVSAPQSREESGEDEDALRPIVIDGSNVAMSHGNKEVFSCLGIQLAVDFFLERGHTAVTVFVPSWRKEQPRPDVPITDQHILHDLERRKILVFTPSRRVAGKRVVCNDDCFIVKLGYESDGIIVSNDMYRDLQGEKPEWKRFIEERLLMYSFVNNKFMPPDDPLGRHGPTLENFLRRFPKTQKKHLCPYGKKCTYGIKCKFHHPERAQQSNRLVADELRENAKHASAAQKHPSACPSPVPGQSILLVEDMARKLTLGHESTSVKRDHKNEHVAQVKTSHRSSKKATSRKEKSGHHSNPEHISGRHGECQEKLDSGLGSIDSQPLEASWNLCDYQYGPTYRSGHHVHNVQQQCCLPQSTTCSCCSHGPPAFHPHGQHQSIGPISGHGAEMIPYGPVRYPSYGAYPVSVPPAFQHNRVHNHQQQTYWSDPFGVQSVPGERSQWESPQGGQPNREEREVVRKKLLAIFSAHLVDTAMERFPQVMDPQMLVAEILMLQSQNRSLR